MTKFTTAAASKSAPIPTYVGGIEIVKIVREHRAVEGGGSKSFGEYVDEVIEEALAKGEEIQHFTVEINDDHWNAMRMQHSQRDNGFAEPAY